MKLAWILVLCLMVSVALAKDNNKSKRKERNRNKRVRGDAPIADVEVEVDDDDEAGEYETIDVIQEGGQEEEQRYLNPCNRHACKRGEACVVEEGQAVCVCMECEEPKPDDNVVKVCSTKNVTYQSECHLDRDHCLCRRNQPGCSNNRENKIRLDYYGECKELTECPDNELEMFPNRMREWLFQVMNDMTMRGYDEMNAYRDMLEKARVDEDRTEAVVWKFCDLDVHPTDRHVTRRELMYIIKSVKPMEHCLVPFLNSCDADDDNTISLQEWAACLKTDQDKITDQCKDNKTA